MYTIIHAIIKQAILKDFRGSDTQWVSEFREKSTKDKT